MSDAPVTLAPSTLLERPGPAGLAAPVSATSRYLDYLPAVFREGDGPLGGLLLAFEHILSGWGDPAEPGLEELLDGIDGVGGLLLAGSERYFTPGPTLPDGLRAPDTFLDWLAGWVALAVRDDWTAAEKRRLIAGVVGLYPQRGTRRGLAAMLKLYLGYEGGQGAGGEGPEDVISIEEPADKPHYFTVHIKLNLSSSEHSTLDRVEEIARAIIDQEKPAHTYYTLSFSGVRTMRLTDSTKSTVQLGKNSLLGSA